MRSKGRRAQRRAQERAELRAKEQPGKALTVPPTVAELAKQLKQQQVTSR